MRGGTHRTFGANPVLILVSLFVLPHQVATHFGGGGAFGNLKLTWLNQ